MQGMRQQSGMGSFKMFAAPEVPSQDFQMMTGVYANGSGYPNYYANPAGSTRGAYQVGMRFKAEAEAALQAALQALGPLPEESSARSQCMMQLKAAVKQLGPTWHVKAFGSAANGFITRGADLDVTCYQPEVQDQANHLAVQELKLNLLPLLRQLPEFEIVQEVWAARVPIVKLKFGKMDVDLSCHNPQALQNTHLLRSYSELCPVVRQLVLCVKYWAKAEGVLGATTGHLSSYSFTLMVLYFLQVEEDLAMPCLPTLCFSSQGASQQIAGFSWSCHVPLSILLGRFFQFYASIFHWGSEVVSVRSGTRLAAHDLSFSSLPGITAQRLHIEDPFLPRNLNCVLSPENEMMLTAKFLEASALMQGGGVPEAFLQAEQEQRRQQTLQSMQWPTQDMHWHQGQSDRGQHGFSQASASSFNHQGEDVAAPSTWQRNVADQHLQSSQSDRGQWLQGQPAPRVPPASKRETIGKGIGKGTPAQHPANAKETEGQGTFKDFALQKLSSKQETLTVSDGESTRSGSVSGTYSGAEPDFVSALSKTNPGKKSSALAWLEEGLEQMQPSPLPEHVPSPDTFRL
eukprot:gb/GFBE01012675.1/.p1 GENE.gb/GFBE01012675.1/~~gb/GFBE01012675.1/.p1  ORF type:complete len:573 (+),score=103.84 gb/GFBE01012675.1/:1-1719(+)